MIKAFPPARWAVPVATVLLMAACATPKPRIEPPPPAPPPLDASYDWHVLVIAPFGSVLKDIPLGLHEVLLFRDTDSAAPSAEDFECYAANATAPRFVARQPSEYLLCFKHDRLSRIEATVRVPKNDTAQVLADACGLWMKNAQPPKAEVLKSEVPKDGCEGADGGVAFAAGSESAADEGDSQLTIQLDATDLASDAASTRARQ